MCALFFLLSLSSSLASELEQEVVRVLWNLLLLCSYPVLLTTRHLDPPLLSLLATGNASPSSRISFNGVDVALVLPGDGMVLYFGVNEPTLSPNAPKGRSGIDTVDDSVRIVVVVVVVLASADFGEPVVEEESRDDRCCAPILHLFAGTGPTDFKHSDTGFGLFSVLVPFLAQLGDPSSSRFFRFSWLVGSNFVAAGTWSTS